ncbi:pheromone-processing carboxypeptidase KEX1 isoform X2 [Manihot esculenta]|uniref:pheromone-processing carboxypeptidase KEX1 isoform X2 n=1 Tax=Manihot esculenta TaxID=3983 RepID=UPI001CC38F3A|nr:pheromone-processing carboxypeptidase KEX1 isoform X2 [Manihot esculenta]XP_043811959.1 pheromone-processing carboxypeptidase KEX1 isoform X2 [Manihot esculenta]
MQSYKIFGKALLIILKRLFQRVSVENLSVSLLMFYSQSVDIERFSDWGKSKSTSKRDKLNNFLQLTSVHFPAELVQGVKTEQRNPKKVRWNPDSDLKKFDLFEKLEQKYQGREEKDEKEKKEGEDEEEDEDEEVDEAEEEFSDDDYLQNVDFDDDEDDYNNDDGNDDEPVY